MYCSDEREIAFNILCFPFKLVYTLLGTVSKSLHICAFDFFCLATAFIIAALVWIVMCFLLLVALVDMITMEDENASKYKDLDLCSVRHNDGG